MFFTISLIKDLFLDHKKSIFMSSNSGTGHIIQSLIVNLLITLSKGFAAFMTSSGAMLAETIHSFADCANQALLLVGVKQSYKKPDEAHPFGYGTSVYFWSFMVAMLLFSIGGMFSIYEGIHKYNHPEPIHNVAWGLGVLIFSLLLEGYAAYSNVVEINKRKKNKNFLEYLQSTKDSDLVVIFGENSAAVLGLTIAIAALLFAYYTGDGRYDGIGSFIIGVVLIAVAIFLAKEVKSLLIGESADPEVIHNVKQILEHHPEVNKMINCRSVQQGPGEVLMCVKIHCNPNITALELSRTINTLEAEIRAKMPEVKYLYIEPDLEEWK
jgi:cation diffusion facilitator family transporter